MRHLMFKSIGFIARRIGGNSDWVNVQFDKFIECHQHILLDNFTLHSFTTLDAQTQGFDFFQVFSPFPEYCSTFVFA